jgi:tRNA-uridine 2-sulfurtransferase
MKLKVAVAMSGGVDSSVAAGLLLEQGHEVMGITMLHYDSPCRKSETSVEDAARVCRTLGIPHHVVDLRNDFEQWVIADFIGEYLAGRTPNPCVRCNATIKWGKLLEAALSLGAERIATGHYVNIRFDETSRRFQIIKSEHRAKDQSYALWRLTQDQLARTLFPIANLQKTAVRDKAAAIGLDIAHKAESQDICFIPDDDYARFLEASLEKRGERIKSGDIVDQARKVLGQHKGYPFYTIGQRKGLGIALGRPAFVVEIDAEKNQIRIGEKEELFSSGLIAGQTNWVSTDKPSVGMKVMAHIRYNDPGYAAVLSNVTDDSITARFDEPRTSVTPGQSAVFYDNDVLLGGGIIEAAIK